MFLVKHFTSSINIQVAKKYNFNLKFHCYLGLHRTIHAKLSHTEIRSNLVKGQECSCKCNSESTLTA